MSSSVWSEVIERLMDEREQDPNHYDYYTECLREAIIKLKEHEAKSVSLLTKLICKVKGHKYISRRYNKQVDEVLCSRCYKRLEYTITSDKWQV